MPVFLKFHGSECGMGQVEIRPYDDQPVLYLPDKMTSDPQLAAAKDDDHTSIKLDFGYCYCLLSAYSENCQPIVLCNNDIEVEVPLSTPEHEFSVIVTGDHKILTPTGTWVVIWDEDDHHQWTVPLEDIQGRTDVSNRNSGEESEESGETVELVPSPRGHALIDRRELPDEDDLDGHESVPITEIRLSPTPSTSSTQDAGHNADETPRSETNQASKAIHEDKQVDSDQESIQASITTHDNKADSPSKDPVDTACDSQSNRISFINIPKTNLLTKTGEKSSVVSTDAEPKYNDGDTGIGTSDLQLSSDPVRSGGSSHSILDEQNGQITHAVQGLLPKSTFFRGREEQGRSHNEAQQETIPRVPKRRLAEIDQGDDQSGKKIKSKYKSNGASKDLFLGNEETDIISPAAPVGGPMAREAKRVNFSNDLLSAELIEDGNDKKRPPARFHSVDIPSRKDLAVHSERSEILSPSAQVDDCNGRPNIVISSSSNHCDDRVMKSTIRKLGGKLVRNVEDADVLCIGRGQIKKTSKFVIAVATGKNIVTDEWLQRACVDRRFPKCANFLPHDPEREAEWGFSLREAIERGRNGLDLLNGFHVHFTAQLAKELGDMFKELKDVACALGAATTRSKLTKKNAQRPVIVIGGSQNVDSEAGMVKRMGHELYKKDILTMAALRGRLELDSEEFKIEVADEE